MSRQTVDSGQLLAERPPEVDEHDEPAPQAEADVVVKGRNVEIPDHFRVYVSQKLA
ncbi:MAG: ribosomal subunit interface protein, partial [Mycobacterium sp.]